jgi:hypothetical protein
MQFPSGQDPGSPPKTQQAAHRLTRHNLERQDKSFDPSLHAAQATVRALDLQKAGKELGFDLSVQHYTNDRFDLDGWTRQQSR